MFPKVRAWYSSCAPWERRNRYNFSSNKAAEIHAGVQDQIAMLPRDALTKPMIQQAIDSLNAVSATLERLKAEMLELASQFLEYSVVMEMHGMGNSLGPQLMAEIGDMTRFVRRSSITSVSEINPVHKIFLRQPGIAISSDAKYPDYIL